MMVKSLLLTWKVFFVPSPRLVLAPGIGPRSYHSFKRLTVYSGSPCWSPSLTLEALELRPFPLVTPSALTSNERGEIHARMRKLRRRGGSEVDATSCAGWHEACRDQTSILGRTAFLRPSVMQRTRIECAFSSDRQTSNMRRRAV
jgi:hypothetical protein